MGKGWRWCVAWLAAVLAAAVPAADPAQPPGGGPVVLATHELCPYGCTGPDGRFDGLALRTTRCAFGRLGVPLEVRVLPWARAQEEARNGAADGFFGASRSAARDEWAVLSTPVAPQQWRWYLLAGNPLDPAQASFREQAAVASYVGANMLAWLEQEGYRVASRPPDTPALLASLVAGRVDAVLANNLVMDRLLAGQGLQQRVRSHLAQDKPLGVYFTRRFLAGRPGFLAGFDAAVAACRAPG